MYNLTSIRLFIFPNFIIKNNQQTETKTPLFAQPPSNLWDFKKFENQPLADAFTTGII